jgi:hypothetical protein
VQVHRLDSLEQESRGTGVRLSVAGEMQVKRKEFLEQEQCKYSTYLHRFGIGRGTV